MMFHQSPNRYIDEVHLYVTDLKKSLSFYVNMLGFRVLAETDRVVNLTADGHSALITLEQPEGIAAKEERRTGLYHYALLLPERSALADVLKYLLKNGYPLQGASDHLVSEAVYLADPDGNGIEIYTDRDPERWSWENGEVVMAAEALDAEELFREETGIWHGIPENTVIGHIHLHVAELEKIRRFYVEGLGFDIVNSKYGSQVLFLSTGNYHHHIGLNTWAGKGAPPPGNNTAGMAFYSIRLPDQQILKQTFQQLEAMGAPLEKQTHGWLAADPSGNKIRLRSE